MIYYQIHHEISPPVELSILYFIERRKQDRADAAEARKAQFSKIIGRRDQQAVDSGTESESKSLL